MTVKQNTLLDALVSSTGNRRKNRVTFEAAMKKIGVSSVFDIALMSKADFVRQLARFSDANGAQAYDNAVAYTTLIARLYREHQTSSTTSQALDARSGVRAMAPQGPIFSALFAEDWDNFCRPGAVGADDSPAAYLSALKVFVGQLESTSTDPARLLLDRRRPDLKSLLITPESTFTPQPMLEIVNDVLTRNLLAYLQTVPADKGKALPAVLSERQYPFALPYNFYHHQCLLGLSGTKPGLGLLNYRISLKLPITQDAGNAYGAVQQPAAQAQQLMTGLSPQQQRLLTAAAPFSHFYLNRNDLTVNWKSPGNCHLSPHAPMPTGYVLPDGQAAVGVGSPAVTAPVSTSSGTNTVPITFERAGHSDKQIVPMFFASGAAVNNTTYRFNHLHAASRATVCVHIRTHSALPPLTPAGYNATFDMLLLSGTVAHPLSKARRRVTLTLDEEYQLSDVQKNYFTSTFGVDISTTDTGLLANLDTFMQHTGLHAQEVEMLFSRRGFEVRLSPNCPSTNAQSAGLLGNLGRAFPHANHYGACYINGVGSDNYTASTLATTVPHQYEQFDNAMDLQPFEFGDKKIWRLTLTSLDRLDRLQRMIRLQRWTKIPFAKLDTLVINAMRAEVKTNLSLEPNDNTLRALGVYHFLDQRYGIDPEEFAALMHHLTPYTNNKDDKALFDKVFNEVLVFDSPLVLTQAAFNLTDPAHRKTVMQLCAGLGLQPTGDSLGLIAAQTQRWLGSLKLDLNTVSSLFRQARIARFFGYTVAELLTLANLLGGQHFKTQLASGQLGSQTGNNNADILDVLMQLCWAAQWLVESKQTVAQLQRRLGPNIPLMQPHDGARRPQVEAEQLSDDLRTRLTTLQVDVGRKVVTQSQISTLNLPATNDDDQPLDWFTLLTSFNVLNATGLLIGLDQMTFTDEPMNWLGRSLDNLLAAQKLAPGVKQASKAKLIALLLDTHDHQVHLLATLLQETTQLPVDRAVAVAHWANTSVFSILLDAQGDGPELIEQFQRVSRHAEIVVQLRLSNRALRTFVLNPQWLGAYPITNSEPSLADLYLLERFSAWQQAQSQPEDSLLSYFSLANPPAAKRKNKTQRKRVSTAANAELATLLNWTSIEIENLATLLPDGIATSMEQVDWIRRCQETCAASGLSAQNLLQATALNASSSLTDWKTVGEAAVVGDGMA
ncbi:Tc toxin subunit A [Pseudomonas azadiae]|uniref:Virulence plasmid A protein n=2 Tax=Pseudomonas TaxID=286 RepID=A0ABS6NVZ7_9PSED|nr:MULTISPECIES: Tc toxin subunit A [Pseudomonas]MBV4452392.1 hypothetical protein [Pseudomonas azadiae]NMF42261.1 hypothetical protein [Pseudomonas sp. SWRI 103]